jgi:acetyl esterase
MTVEPKVQELLDLLAATPTDLATLTPAQLREQYRLQASMSSGPQMATADSSVPGPAGPIPVRVYEPAGSSAGGPTIVWYHGGGWVIGDLVAADPTCRRLAAASGMRLVSVDYRLAPEHRYPAAADDAYAALEAVTSGALGGPASWLAVGGDSAGGNLAAVVSHMAKDRGGRIPDFQLLVYPCTDLLADNPSLRDNGEGYLLTTAMMTWFQDHYIDKPQLGDAYASPSRASSLVGLPPAHVITAEFDPLRDEGEGYAKQLADAGVAVGSVRYDGQIHGFFGSPELFGPTGQRAVDDAGAVLRAAAGLPVG